MTITLEDAFEYVRLAAIDNRAAESLWYHVEDNATEQDFDVFVELVDKIKRRAR